MHVQCLLHGHAVNCPLLYQTLEAIDYAAGESVVTHSTTYYGSWPRLKDRSTS